MKSFNEPQRIIKIYEPVFHMKDKLDYGRIVNLGNPKVLALFNLYVEKTREKAIFPLSDRKFKIFEILVSRIFSNEFREFINSFGGLENAKRAFDSANKPSNLINYWAERAEKYEDTFSTTCQGERQRVLSA